MPKCSERLRCLFHFLAFITLFLIPFACDRKTENPSSLHWQEEVNKISIEDREKLEFFFKFLVTTDDFAFTLFGEKPLSFLSYPTHEPSPTYQGFILEQGWQCWEKYASRFPSKQFILVKTSDSVNDCPVNTLTLINRQKAKECIEQHLVTFQTILGENIPTDVILQNLCKEGLSEKTILKDDTELLGILLGYGAHNAWAFKRRAEICLFYNQHPDEQSKDFACLSDESKRFVSLYSSVIVPHISTLKPSLSYHSLVEELNDITAHTDFFNLDGIDLFLSSFQTPIFMTFEPNEETQQLKQQYTKTYELIRQKYQNTSYFEATIEQWTSG